MRPDGIEENMHLTPILKKTSQEFNTVRAARIAAVEIFEELPSGLQGTPW